MMAKIALYLQRSALTMWYANVLQERNPYVIYTTKEQTRLCAGLSALDIIMREALFLFVFKQAFLS